MKMYRVGDKVVVKKDLGVKDIKGTNLYAEEMDWLKGETVTISKLHLNTTYLVKESIYGIYPEMIDHVATKKLNIEE